MDLKLNKFFIVRNEYLKIYYNCIWIYLNKCRYIECKIEFCKNCEFKWGIVVLYYEVINY